MEFDNRGVEPAAAVDRLLAELTRWAADERAAEAADRRRRERWLRQQQLEEATLDGVAMDLAERRIPVAITLHGGRRLTGTVACVAADFWVVTGATTPVLVASGGVATVRPGAGAAVGDATGSRASRLTMRLGDALAGLAADRPRVLLGTRDGEALTGELRAMGTDVVSIRLDTPPAQSAYVALAAITDCVLLQV